MINISQMKAQHRTYRIQARLDYKIGKKLADRERHCLRQARKQFARFFRWKSFTIGKGKEKITAKARDYKIELHTLRPFPAEMTVRTEALNQERFVKTMLLVIEKPIEAHVIRTEIYKISLVSHMGERMSDADLDLLSRTKKKLKSVKRMTFAYKVTAHGVTYEKKRLKDILELFIVRSNPTTNSKQVHA